MLEIVYGRPVVPGTVTALFSRPSKMPGYAWGIPAGNPRNGQPNGACPGAVFGENSICGSCYATSKKGKYGMANVQNAQKLRLQWTMECLMTAEGQERWIATMIAGIRWTIRPSKRNAPVPFFRIHDSGDMFNPRYVEMWGRVINALPEVSFWTPTRSYHSTPRILAALQRLATLPNVTVRPSALQINEPAPRIPGLHAGSAVSTNGMDTCPAYKQGNSCGTCRHCWVNKDIAVVYKKH